MLVAVAGPLHPPADRRGRRLSQGCVLMSRRGASEHLAPELSEPFGVDRTLASHHILGMRVDATSYGDATCRIVGWARGRESRYVCVASVNNVMQSYDAPAFRRLMNDADLMTPDGMPLVWGLRALGDSKAGRVDGEPSRSHPRRHGGGGSGLRFPVWPQASGAWLHAASGHGVAVPSRHRAPPAVAALPLSEPSVSRAFRLAARPG